MNPTQLIVEAIIAEHHLDDFEAAIVRMRAWHNPEEARRIAESIRPLVAKK